jgi:hypothetical protein
MKWVAVLTVGFLVGGGTAFAYWTNTGSGPGSATTGTNAVVVVNQTSTVTGLAPGLPAQPLSGNFDNPNAGPVYVGAVTATVTGTDKAGCGPTDYIIAGTAVVNAEIVSGNDVGAWSGLTIQFNNKPTTNQDVCKEAAVTIAYTSS